MNKRDSTLAILFAGVAGFLIGWLTAPQSGLDTRADIKNKTLDGKDEVLQAAKKAQSELESSINDLTDYAKEQTGRAKAGANNRLTEAKEAKEYVENTIKSFAKQKSDTTELKAALAEAKASIRHITSYLKG